MTRYPLSTPLRVLRGGSDQEMTATSDVMEMARTFSGGWLGTEEGAVSRRMMPAPLPCAHLQELCPVSEPPRIHPPGSPAPWLSMGPLAPAPLSFSPSP